VTGTNKKHANIFASGCSKGYMPRPPRIDYPGLVYHVFNRGAKQLPIFHDEEDRLVFLGWMDEMKRRSAIEIEHYSLMTNHYHLLLRLHDGSLSKAFQHTMGCYARWFNWKYRLSGHLFQGRFRSIPVEVDRYYLTVVRYIQLNAVKAGIVLKPEDYRWSNYARLIRGEKDELATGGMILDFWNAPEENQRLGYRRFAEDGISLPDPVSEKVLRRMRAWGAIPQKPSGLLLPC